MVYNLDGSIHLVVSTPLLKTPDEKGNYNKGYCFGHLGWRKNREDKTVLYLSIDEKEWDWLPWYEEREFNPETGEFGDLLFRATH